MQMFMIEGMDKVREVIKKNRAQKNRRERKHRICYWQRSKKA